MWTWLAVAVGGAIGTLFRHAVNILSTRLLGSPGLYATAAVNVVGCAVIGFLAGRIASGDLRLTTTMRTFVFVGLLGGFTTFSSFGLDTFTLAHSGHRIAAAINVTVQVSAGLVAVFVGFWLAAR
ncbi:MAG: CrcB family protein [Acidobacteriota bacterium]